MLTKNVLRVAVAACLASPFAFAAPPTEMGSDVEITAAEAGAAVSFATQQDSAALVDLGTPDVGDLAALGDRRRDNARLGEPLEIAMARDVAKPEIELDLLDWEPLADGGIGARVRIVSEGAVALRAALEVTNLRTDTSRLSKVPADGIVLRFRGDGGEVFEVSGADIDAQDTTWSPIVDGEAMTIEIVLAPGRSPDQLALRIPQVSHFDLAPTATHATMGAKIGESDYCERDIVCRASPSASFLSTSKAVARMVFTKSGSSYLCTGTLLNNSNSPKRYLFWTASHCINTQTVANTLQTYWFYEATTCNGSTVNPSATTRTGGAFLRHSNATRDTALLELKTAPPSGSVYAGWTSAAITSTGTAIEGIHHPAGDVKKYSLGSVTSTSTSLSGLGPFYRVQWSLGVTEGGSSGSGLFTVSSGNLQLRGGLYGGSSYCSAPTAPDYYSRFSDVYSSISSYF